MARPSAAQLHAFADQLAPAVRRQFLLAMQRLQARVTLDDLVEAVTRGGGTLKLDAKMAGLSNELRAAVATLNRVFDDASRKQEQELQQRYRLSLRFDVVNPNALTAASQGARLVREVTEQTRRGLQAVVRRAIDDGIAPREAARLIKPMIGLTDRQSFAVINYRFSLLEAGSSPEAVNKAARVYAEKLLTQRARTIARTETIRAGREGRQATWDQAKAEGLIPDEAVQRWIVSDDDRLCPACEPLDGVEVPLGQQFPRGGGDGPPLHPNCRCSSTLIIPRRQRAAA